VPQEEHIEEEETKARQPERDRRMVVLSLSEEEKKFMPPTQNLSPMHTQDGTEESQINAVSNFTGIS
jgi:hypothetical protein